MIFEHKKNEIKYLNTPECVLLGLYVVAIEPHSFVKVG